ncbi:ABC transporter substrate binding protein [Flexibacterium corallicola]|uniref:ABC transporter substrate binding protein n=1 Tax=Flexibacterium corallicola TaxID=3037259 RepID=UPI00286F5331|nr:ABC transporter substrate binding protein [Pseudovibrio sp. M1P-2-3]
MPKLLQLVVFAVSTLVLVFSAAAKVQPLTTSRVHMVVWRGCEEACQGFIRYFEERELPVKVSVTDVARDKSALEAVKEKINASRPDLVVTWGTTVTRSLIGTIEDHGAESGLGDIPALFMIVADPVRSGIIESYATSGRPLVTGVHNRVKEEVQLNQIFEYHRPKRLAVINDPSAINSSLNTQTLLGLSKKMGFELLQFEYALNERGKPDPVQIPALIAQAKEQGAEAIYVGSSSFNLENRGAFTNEAVAQNLPVFSAYEQMVRDGMALMSVSNSYVNVGKLAASQAAKILLDGMEPGQLRVKALDRYSLFVNMRAARQLKLYPPLPIVNMAEIIQ